MFCVSRLLPSQTAGACKNLQQDAVMACLGHADCLNRFCDGANLVDLEQQGIACLLFNGCLHPLGIGAQQVIANHLHQQTAAVPVNLFHDYVCRFECMTRTHIPSWGANTNLAIRS